MVTDVLIDAEQQGDLTTFAEDDAEAHAPMRALFRRIVRLAEADAALSPCISRPQPGQTAPFANDAGA